MIETKDTMCFACGRANPVSLGMTFYIDADRSYCSKFVGQPEHVGYQNMMHGGIIATLLDECLSRAVIEEGFLAVTAELHVKYLKPTPVGEELTICARIEKNRGKLYNVVGEITLANGEICAKAKAKIFAINEQSFADDSVQPDRSRLQNVNSQQ
ncbi:MAG: PaaI family thioesterase [Negativicutes bacterium]|jgi:uncharacterized protein (TIGR00369 family)